MKERLNAHFIARPIIENPLFLLGFSLMVARCATTPFEYSPLGSFKEEELEDFTFIIF